jgi:hypothetical protein
MIFHESSKLFDYGGAGACMKNQHPFYAPVSLIESVFPHWHQEHVQCGSKQRTLQHFQPHKGFREDLKW